VRLPEAKQLIQKALEFAPGDPFISDSLAWVEFRMGNRPRRCASCRPPTRTRPTPRSPPTWAKCCGAMGQRDQAQSVWREGLLLNAENETLQETLKRLKVKP
jgi:hypothetical protein